MTLWERTITNMQNGYERLAVFAAHLSDRVKAEINIVRLRMQLDDVRDRIRDQQAFIGRRLLELRDRGGHAGSLDHFFRNDEIAAAQADISRLEKDVLNILDDLRSETDSLKAVPPPSPDEEKAA
jgi:hypothetical protein